MMLRTAMLLLAVLTFQMLSAQPLTFQTLSAQPLCHVTQYDEDDGVASNHITQLLQDEQGFLWFATWNGLCRYDGYEFRTFKSQVGDGCTMMTDRIRNIDLLADGQMLCQVDNQFFRFDLKSYRFHDLSDAEQQEAKALIGKHRASRSLQRKPYTWTDSHHTQWTLDGSGHLSYLDAMSGQQTDYPLQRTFRTLTFAMADRQGNLWALDYSNIYKLTTDAQRTQRLAIEPRAEVKCLFADSKGRYWVATKDDETVRIYRSSDNQLLGYLGADGAIHTAYTRFGAAVYCMYESADGTLWLGTKPKGLFRLREERPRVFKIAHFIDISCPDVYHITADRQGRLWVATLGGGVLYTTEPNAEKPHFIAPRHYPDAGQRARYLLITHDDILMVATSGGLLVAQLKADAGDMHFLLHQRQPNRQESLSCSATMDVAQDGRGRYFVSTESGGINMIENTHLLDSVLTFRHLREQFHAQPNDIVLSLTPTGDDGMLAVGSHLITLLDSTLQGRMLDTRNFSLEYRFSEAHPLKFSDGRWLFGLLDGAFFTTTGQLRQQASMPQVVLTYLEVEGDRKDVRGMWNAESLDTLTLQPGERSLTVRFAALDYNAASRICYAFRLLPNERWNYIGHDRSATLLDLEPGTYRLEIRSTNGDGEWADHVRMLTIIVKPTFWEAWYGQLLIALLVVGVMAAIAYTLLYIRRIKRQQSETLEKYLALIEGRGQNEEVGGDESSKAILHSPVSVLHSQLDPMLERVMKFVEENISNSDAGVGDMAEAAAVSRSGLQRKLKQAMGITPQDLMKEARIKRACQLLRQTDKNISEVAYACGFADPKYFSRSFRQSTGLSPTEYREKGGMTKVE